MMNVVVSGGNGKGRRSQNSDSSTGQKVEKEEKVF